MLENLSISNYALIENVNLTFRPGLTIITGETGAGKSIMLDALSLLLGERAETKAITDKSRKSVIEAVFVNPDINLKNIFEEHSLDWNDSEILVRREINASGRSRAFVNDTPVTLPVLAAVAGRLLDIHSQNSNTNLSNPDAQLSMLDAFCRNEKIIQDYKDCFSRYVTLRTKIRKARENFERNSNNRDFIAFQLEQLDKINPREGELKTVEQEFDLLSDADQIRENLGKACHCLETSDTSALNRLNEAATELRKVNLDIFGTEETGDIVNRLENALIEIKDISETLADWLDRVETDPSRLAKVTERMNLLYDAVKHFKVADENGLVTLRKNLRAQLDIIDFGDDDISAMEAEAKAIGRSLKEKADVISSKRREGAVDLEKLVIEKTTPLGLHNLRFKIEINQIKPTPDGQDHAVFMCSFNKNHPLQPVSKIASGGENARLMLALKSIMAGTANLPTVIFDEVDTGVSGDIADRMGKMMKEMGTGMQVLAITHLPQVAAKGDTHFKVYKTDDQERTVSHVKELDHDARVREIASMLSGSHVNEAAMLNARTLLDSSDE